MRIVAGGWRGRALGAPDGAGTRPTADRVRQALFDSLLHAPWAPWRGTLAGARVLDAFAGTGALGLEALSRGAAHATFLERDRTALATLRHNARACARTPMEAARLDIRQGDATRPPRAAAPCGLVFLDPPYGMGLIARAWPALAGAGWFAPGAIVVTETRADETGADEAEDVPTGDAPLLDRRHGAARLRAYVVGPVSPG